MNTDLEKELLATVKTHPRTAIVKAFGEGRLAGMAEARAALDSAPSPDAKSENVNHPAYSEFMRAWELHSTLRDEFETAERYFLRGHSWAKSEPSQVGGGDDQSTPLYVRSGESLWVVDPKEFAAGNLGSNISEIYREVTVIELKPGHWEHSKNGDMESFTWIEGDKPSGDEPSSNPLQLDDALTEAKREAYAECAEMVGRNMYDHHTLYDMLMIKAKAAKVEG